MSAPKSDCGVFPPPRPYWCRVCGKSRECAERTCLSADCADRRRGEDHEAARPWSAWRYES